MIITNRYTTLHIKDNLVYKQFACYSKYIIEVNYLKKLEHIDSVISLINYSDNQIILPYIPHLLEDLIINKQLSKENKYIIINQIISFMKAIHKLNIVHNDLKAKNILVCKDFQTIKIIDFDLSKNDNNNSNDIKKFKFLVIQLLHDIDYKTSYQKFNYYVTKNQLEYENIILLLNK
jgi:serine/threonine protein kinase